MSEELGILKTRDIEVGPYATTHDLAITAYWGGNDGRCVQLSFDKEICSLSEKDTRKLIDILTKRLL